MSDHQVPPVPPYSASSPATAGTTGSGPRLPWEERDRLGFLEALGQTIKLLATDPSAAFARLRADGDYLSPLIFGLILSWLGMIVSQLWGVLVGSAISSLSGDFAALSFFGGGVEVLVWLAIWPVVYLIGTFIAAGILHLCLLVLSALEHSEMQFEGTFKVVAYSSVTQLASVVPFLGSWISLIWSLVLLVLGFMAVHRATQTQAILAALIPAAICCVCIIVVVVFFGVGLAAVLGGAAAGVGGAG